jgi:FkbM family methyltransferase
MSTRLRTVLGNALTPAARAWIRYSPLPLGKAWLWQNFHWRARNFTCRTVDGNLVTGSTEDLIQRHLYYFGTWEPNISWWMASTLRPGDGFIDVGANIGHYSLLASNLVGDQGRVVAIEAAQWIHATLDRHVRMNRRDNIRTVQVAAAETPGMLRLFHGNPGNIGKTTTIAREGASSDVRALPLSAILRDEEIDRARIIKIDVEGAELQVLRGLAPVLGRLRDDVEIVMEITPGQMPDADNARAEIFATMQASGFRAFVFDNDYGVETYLARHSHKRPVSLADPALSNQADILFSRAAY